MNKLELTLAMAFSLLLLLVAQFAILGVCGAVIAFAWNNFLVPNTEMPVIFWWQAAIGLWVLEVIKIMIFGNNSK